MSSPSSPEAILERATSLCNEAVFTIALQRRRLRGAEPEDNDFIFRYWADLQFLIVALRRLRRSASIAAQVPAAKHAIGSAIVDFDKAIPGLAVMRNVGEHIDAYALDEPKRHRLDIDGRQLQVGSWNGTIFNWLGHTIDIDVAFSAAKKLSLAVKHVDPSR